MPCPLKTTGSRLYVPLYLLAVAVTLFWTYAICEFWMLTKQKLGLFKDLCEIGFLPKEFHGRPTPIHPETRLHPFLKKELFSNLRPLRIQNLGRGAPKLASGITVENPRYFGKEKHLTKTHDQQLHESNNSKRDSWQEFTPGDSVRDLFFGMVKTWTF